ncbi:MAG: family 16 glycoside hydrolase, partial [Pirellulaceae bacterium]
MYHRLLSIIPLALICPALVAQEPGNNVPAEPAGMRALFNGSDLTGWDGDPRLWSVKDGVLHGETTEEKPAKGNTFLIWKDGKIKDFDLRLS